MSYPAQELLEEARRGFYDIGYRDDLVFRDYRFADFLSPSYNVRRIPLAGFAQHPPSYRSAGFGVLISNGVQPKLSDFLALGAPHLFLIAESEGQVQRWQMLADEPKLIQRIEPDNFLATIRANRKSWGPEGVLRARSLTMPDRPEQLDFYDIGLLPVLEREVHIKLDSLFRRTIAAAIDMHSRLYGREMRDYEYKGLFRLIFRLVASKLLADREYPGEWSPADVQRALGRVTDFYFRTTLAEPIEIDLEIQQLIWDQIRTGFHLQNLSLEALAYVYENTFVTSRTRRMYGTHATPPEVVEYVVNNLPFEQITDPNERTVFEPFSGHAPFLTASLGRLRALLPSDVSIKERHQYFIQMLSGIEVDSFAREVARYSLILADYPNPDGWRIEDIDGFGSTAFRNLLARANIVLCNPPFGQFTAAERERYPNLRSPDKAVETLLRVLDQPPRLLGFVLPRSFLDGRKFQVPRDRLADIYGQVSILALPDIVFSHSEAEPVVVLASERGGDLKHRRRLFVAKEDYERFRYTYEPTWVDEEVFSKEDGHAVPLWRNPLAKNLRKHLEQFTPLGEVAEIHRGIEYNGPVGSHTSEVPRPGYAKGLQTVSDGLKPYVIDGFRYLDTNPEAMRTGAYLQPWDQIKVIANAARISRGPWRVMAAVDPTGLVCYQRFHGVWPKGDFSPVLIAATLNGLVANTLLSLEETSRDNLASDLARIPIPPLSYDDLNTLNLLHYAFREGASISPQQLQSVVVQIETLVLSSYDLPFWLLSELLDYGGKTVHPYLGASFVDLLHLRHGELVDKKFLDGLTAEETIELSRNNHLLDASEVSFYAPIEDYLLSIEATLLANRRGN